MSASYSLNWTVKCMHRLHSMSTPITLSHSRDFHGAPRLFFAIPAQRFIHLLTFRCRIKLNLAKIWFPRTGKGDAMKPSGSEALKVWITDRITMWSWNGDMPLKSYGFSWNRTSLPLWYHFIRFIFPNLLRARQEACKSVVHAWCVDMEGYNSKLVQVQNTLKLISDDTIKNA